MKITQEDVVEQQTVLHVELESEDVDKYLDRAYKRVVQNTNIPGFRKGKAPRAVLERYVGREALLDEAMEFILLDCPASAIEQQNLKASGNPVVEVEQVDPTVQFKATVPLEPLVELGVYRDIRMEEEEVEVTDDQVTEALEQIRGEAAVWEPVERAAAMTDMLTVNVTGKAEGDVVIEESDAVFTLEDTDLPFPGFPQQIVGIDKGGSKEFSLVIPEDFQDTRLAGKECNFSVEVLEIKERSLPDLDDELAKGVGDGFESLETLKQKVTEDLKTHAEREGRRRYQDQILETLLLGVTVSVPPLLVEHEIDHMIQDQERALQNQQMSMDQYLLSAGKTSEQLREELKEDSLNRIRRSFVLSKVAELEGIEVTDTDVDERVNTIVPGNTPSEMEIKRYFNSEEGKASIRVMVRNDKVFERLTDIARGGTSEKEPSAKEEEPATEEKVDSEPAAGGS